MSKMKRDKDKLEFAERLRQAVRDHHHCEYNDKKLKLRSGLAKLFGIDHAAVRRWFDGDSKPTVEHCITLAERLGVDFQYLYTGQRAGHLTAADVELVIKIKESVLAAAANNPRPISEAIALEVIALTFRDIQRGMPKSQALSYSRLQDVFHILS